MSLIMSMVHALLGWVLLIGEEFEQGRVIVAIFVSIAFLALHFAVKPFKRWHNAHDPNDPRILPESCLRF